LKQRLLDSTFAIEGLTSIQTTIARYVLIAASGYPLIKSTVIDPVDTVTRAAITRFWALGIKSSSIYGYSMPSISSHFPLLPFLPLTV
jgi:hypothetical protein